MEDTASPASGVAPRRNRLLIGGTENTIQGERAGKIGKAAQLDVIVLQAVAERVTAEGETAESIAKARIRRRGDDRKAEVRARGVLAIANVFIWSSSRLVI